MGGEGTQKRKYNIRVNSPSAVQRLIARTIRKLECGEIEDGRARTIGYLCTILLNSFETINLEKKVAELEKIIQKGEKGSNVKFFKK